MSSRMERYSNYDNSVSSRSDKNKTIYDKIQDLDSYTNIEAVASIENNNEIDINKVKNMLQNRENYKQQQRFGANVKTEYIEEPKPSIEYEEKNYDINEALSKIKRDDKARDSHKLTDEQYEFLKNLKRKEEELKKDEEEIQDMLHTIASNTKIINDDVGLFDDLKSDTMVGDASSIKKIIEEEAKEPKNYEEENELDQSFYTSSLGFTRSDFEELKNINHNIKKSNKTIILLLLTLITIVIICVSIILVK